MITKAFNEEYMATKKKARQTYKLVNNKSRIVNSANDTTQTTLWEDFSAVDIVKPEFEMPIVKHSDNNKMNLDTIIDKRKYKAIFEKTKE